MKTEALPLNGTPLKQNTLHALPLIRLALLGAVALFVAGATRLIAQTNTNNTPATLQISGSGAAVNLNWNNGGTLQFAPSLGGPWTTVTNGVSVLSSSTSPVSGTSKFFRVVNNGIAGTPVSLQQNALSAPLQVESATLQLLSSNTVAGNTRLVLTLTPGSLPSSNLVTLLINDSLTTLRDDGQFPDLVAGDGNFSAVITVNPSDLDAYNAELASLPSPSQISYTFSGRGIIATNILTPFSTSNFIAGGIIHFINNSLATNVFFGPCSGSPTAYDPGKTLMITNLSVVADTNRTWDNNGPPAAFGAGGTGTQMGAWTFGRLMTDMANVGSPGNTVTSASDFVLRCLQSYQFSQTINDDVVPAVPNIQSLVIDPWLAASAAEGLPSNTLDLAIAPFRLLAIANRVDLRGNSTYGSTTGNTCVPSEPAGEARFIFGFIDPSARSGSQYPGNASNQMTVILEYAVPNHTDCEQVQSWAAQWAALNAISFTDTSVIPPDPFSPDLKFNQALQKITDQFAKAGDNRAQMPNQSAIAQVRFNEFMGTEWELRQFNIDVTTGYLVESTVAATPAFPLNVTPTMESFLTNLINSSFCTVGPLLPTPAIPIPTMFLGNSFLGGWAPEGTSLGTNGFPTSGMFWVGTTCNEPCSRHVLSLNACNGCHTQETGTSFTHVNPRAFGVPSTLSSFLTGATPSNPVADPSGCSTNMYSYSDLARRVQDLNALVTCGCNFEMAHIPLQMSH